MQQVLDEIDTIYENLYNDIGSDADDEYEKSIPIELWKQMHINYLYEKPNWYDHLEWMHDKVNMYFPNCKYCSDRRKILDCIKSDDSIQPKIIEKFIELFTIQEFQCIGI